MKSKVFQKSFAIVMMLVMMFSFAFVTSPSASAKSAKKKSVTVSKVAVTNLTKGVLYVAKGKTVAIKTEVSVKPNKKANKKVTYKTKNKKIAKVNKKGVVKGVKVGKTKIVVASKANKKKKTTVKVMVTAPAKGVKLDKTSGNLNVGSKTTLKATVVGKGAAKAVKFTSSNEKVASVDKNGVVTAKKAGSVVITAKTVDGTNKKAICKINVVNSATSNPTNPSKPDPSKPDTIDDGKIGIKESKISFSPGMPVIETTLTSEKSLTKNDFEVKLKLNKNGKYKFTGEIEQLYTFDNITYFLVLDFSELFNRINYQGQDLYFNVSIKGLEGKNTSDFVFSYANIPLTNNDEDIIVSGYVGTTYSQSLNFYNMQGLYTVEMISGKLPRGSYYDESDSRISGTMLEPVDNEKVVFRATDELDNTSTITVTFVIGDVDKIVAENRTFGQSNDKIIQGDITNLSARAYGGSGNYTYKLLDDINGAATLEPDSDEHQYVLFNAKSLNPGTYEVKVEITDRYDSKLKTTATLKVIVTKANKVSIKLNNNSFENVFAYDAIYFADIDNLSFSQGVELQTKYDDQGNVVSYSYDSINLAAGNYMVIATSDDFGVKAINSKLTINGDTEIPFTLPNKSKISVDLKSDVSNPVDTDDYNVYLGIEIFGEVYYIGVPFNAETNKYEIDVPYGKYTLKVLTDSEFFGVPQTVGEETINAANPAENKTISIADINNIKPKCEKSVVEIGNGTVDTDQYGTYIKLTTKNATKYLIDVNSTSSSSYGLKYYVYDENGNIIDEVSQDNYELLPNTDYYLLIKNDSDSKHEYTYSITPIYNIKFNVTNTDLSNVRSYDFIRAVNLDTKETFDAYFDTSYNKETGKIRYNEINIPKGEYKFYGCINGEALTYLYKSYAVDDDKTLDVTLKQKHKITLNLKAKNGDPNEDFISYTVKVNDETLSYDSKNKSYSGSFLEGTYYIQIYLLRSSINQKSFYFTKEVKLTDKDIEMDVEIDTEDDKIRTVLDITGAGKYDIPISSEYSLVKFVPEKDGKYKIETISNIDTYGNLFNYALISLVSDDDSGERNNFCFETDSLKAGKTYYIGVKKYSSNSGAGVNSVTLNVEYIAE